MLNRKTLIIGSLIAFLLPALAVAAPYYVSQPTTIPQFDNSQDLGTSTKAWRNLYIGNTICLGVDCRSSWPSGGGGGSGGVGTTTPWTPLQLVQVVNNSTVKSVATSSLNINTGDLIEGSNLFWTNTRFDTRLSATTSLPNITTLATLSLPYSQLTGVPATFSYPFPSNATSTALAFSNGITIGTLSGVLKGSSGVVSAATNGTDYTLITANSCSAGNHVSAITAAGVISCSADTGSGGAVYLATTSPWNVGDIAQVASNGTVKSIATSTFNLTVSSFASPNISQWTNNSGYLTSSGAVTSIQQTGGGIAQTGAITFATSSVTLNGITHGLTITNSSGAFTFTPTASGNLTVAGGGTGQTTFTSSQLLYGNGTNALTSVATSSGQCTSASGITCSAFTVVGSVSPTFALSGIPNSSLANSTISGIALGNSLNTLTATNGSLTFTGNYDGSVARTVGLNLANANTWSALQTFANASSTYFSSGYASSTNDYVGTLHLPNLATPAGAFLAVDPSGKIIATTTPSSSVGGTETPSGTINGTTVAFTTTNSPIALFLNGTFQTPGGVDYTLTGTSPYTETFNIPPPTGSTITSQYLNGGGGGGGGSGTVPSGLAGQFPYYAANGTTLTATSNIFLAASGFIGIGTTSPVAGFSIASTTSVLAGEYAYATSTAMNIGMASTTNGLIKTGTGATTITVSSYQLYAGQKQTVTVCNPGSTAGAITWANVHYSGGTQPGSTVAASQCDIWYLATVSGTTTPIVVLTGMTPGIQ